MDFRHWNNWHQRVLFNNIICRLVGSQ
ncbi:hypothetical protein Godav_025577 [Gossypium davidsonii]|uniref:Uncharacterized protein n=1 Tax=Gossypium davidsonii TaxID=34287 RepID=A0A7J8T8A4_GOSDV|nr:hypothetical protein [Gossypium davidsonii]MBA0634423.1 hypothetical protein [Gossypium davidsonii]